MIHFVWSPEELLASERAAQIVAETAPEAELKSLEAEATTVPGLEQALFAPSLFTAERAVVVRRAERLNAAAVRELAAALEAEPVADPVCVVAVSERPPAALQRALEAMGRVHRLPRPRRGELTGWVAARMKAAGIVPTGNAAGTLVELVGSRLGDLAQAVEQLAARAGRGGRIRPEHVTAHAPRSAEQPVWRLFDAVAAGDATGAFGILRRLLEQGDEPIALLFALVSQVRLIMRARSVGERQPSVSEADLARQLGVSPGRASVVRRQAAQLSWEWLVAVHELLAEADVELKGGEEGAALPPEIVLERLVDAAVRTGRSEGPASIP